MSVTPASRSVTSPGGTRAEDVPQDQTPADESPTARYNRLRRNRRHVESAARSLAPDMAMEQRKGELEAALHALERRRETPEYQAFKSRQMEGFEEGRRIRDENEFGAGRRRTAFQKAVGEAREKHRRDTSGPMRQFVEGLEEEPWASIRAFHRDLANIPEQHTCAVCLEKWPGMKFPVHTDGRYVCERCHKDREYSIKTWSAENDMDPEVEKAVDEEGPLPELSDVEEALICKASEAIRYYRLAHGNTGYRGHVCFLPQDVRTLQTQLPRRVGQLDWVVFRKQGSTPGNHKDFKVRRSAVSRWLSFLKHNNPVYSDIEIDEAALTSLPEDDHVAGQLPTVEEAAEGEDGPGPEVGVPGTGIRLSQGGTSGQPGQETPAGADVVPQYTEEDMNEMAPNSSGAVGMDSTASEQAAVQEALAAAREGAAGPRSTSVAELPLAWPTVESDAPLNEMTEPNFLAMTFPTLFPTGKAQLRTERRVSVSHDDYFLHLLRHNSGKFQSHTRFRYTALNCEARWRARDVAGVFVSRELAGQTLEAIHQQVQDGDYSTLSRLNKWSQGLRGTRSYWSGVRANAYAWLRFLEYKYDQMPTLFYTMSAAEMHWNWLHKLFDQRVEYLDLAGMDERRIMRLRGEAVAKNPGKVAWAFDHMAKKWHVDVLYKVCGWEEHFMRMEFAQSRGMTHSHCLGLVRSAPTISHLEEALREIQPPVPPIPAPGDPSAAVPTEGGARPVQQSNPEGGPRCREIFDWVEGHLGVSAWHPTHNKADWPPPEGQNAGPPPVNHLRLGFHEIERTPEKVVEDITMLVNRVLMHVHSPYCRCTVRTPGGGEQIVCRMQYDDNEFRRACSCECHAPHPRTHDDVMKGKAPRQCTASQGCCGQPTALPQSRRPACPACRWRIELDRRQKWCLQAPRNHGRLVAFISWFVVGFRANVDSQFILDQGALINYILKYQTKAEKSSSDFNKVFKTLVQEFSRDADPNQADHDLLRSLMTKTLNKTIGERDYSSVETCHLLQVKSGAVGALHHSAIYL